MCTKQYLNRKQLYGTGSVSLSMMLVTVLQGIVTIHDCHHHYHHLYLNHHHHHYTYHLGFYVWDAVYMEKVCVNKPVTISIQYLLYNAHFYRRFLQQWTSPLMDLDSCYVSVRLLL